MPANAGEGRYFVRVPEGVPRDVVCDVLLGAKGLSNQPANRQIHSFCDVYALQRDSVSEGVPRDVTPDRNASVCSASRSCAVITS